MHMVDCARINAECVATYEAAHLAADKHALECSRKVGAPGKVLRG